MRLSIKPLLHGYQVGMHHGDIEFAMHCLSNYDFARWICGSLPLGDLVPEMEEHCDMMKRCGQKAIHTRSIILLGISKNLLEDSEHPTTLDDLRELCAQSEAAVVDCLLKSFKVQFNYLFGHNDEAQKDAEATRDLGFRLKGNCLCPATIFFADSSRWPWPNKVIKSERILEQQRRWSRRSKSGLVMVAMAVCIGFSYLKLNSPQFRRKDVLPSSIGPQSKAQTVEVSSTTRPLLMSEQESTTWNMTAIPFGRLSILTMPFSATGTGAVTKVDDLMNKHGAVIMEAGNEAPPADNGTNSVDSEHGL
jgi:hypothetical protein